jgi:hypothetical protein
VTAISILKDSPSITYCAQRLTLRFVDILTYPKPAVKFTVRNLSSRFSFMVKFHNAEQLVLDHNLTLRMLREMLNMEASVHPL